MYRRRTFCLDKATSGEVKMKVHTGGVLGFGDPEMLATICDDLMPIGTMLMNQQIGLEPLLGMTSLPFIAPGVDELRTIININYEVLYSYHNIIAKEKIKTLHGFRKLMIRTVDRNRSDYFRSLDASPAQMPWCEGIFALATGVITSSHRVSTVSSGSLRPFHLVNWQPNLDKDYSVACETHLPC